MQFRFLIFFATFWLLSCSSQSPDVFRSQRSPAQIFLKEDLSNSEKIKILMNIHKEIPELFSDAARYDIDLLKILENQAELQKLLLNYPEFAKKWEEKKFLEMKIRVMGGASQALESRVIKNSAVDDWKASLTQIAQSLIAEKKGLETNAMIMLRTLENRTSAGFLNGLILNLPSDKVALARELQKKGDWEALERHLEVNLPEVLSNFKSTPPEFDLSKDVLIKKWVNLAGMEKKAGPILDLAILAMNRNLDLKKMIPEINKLDRQDLENMSDRDYQKNAFAKILNKGDVGTPPFYDKHLKFYQSQTEIVQGVAKEGDGLTLKEQNPNSAIFRGCTAGDCSSQYSFPYPNDPNERVFYIYDKDNHLKGAMSTTMVTKDSGETSLYVITISGNRVNSQDTELILQGLYKERKALGVSHIILPAKDNLMGLINFPLIRSVYSEAIEDGASTAITYQDQEIRKTIQDFQSEYNSAEYDYMEKNKKGVVYVPKKSRVIPLQTLVTELPDENKHLKTEFKFDAISFLEFQMALKKSKRSSLIQEVQKLAVFDGEEGRILSEMSDIILNKKSVSSAEIEEAVEEFGRTFSLSDAQQKNMKQRYLFNAYLKATDSTDEPYLSQNIKRLLDDFKYKALPPMTGRDEVVYEMWGKLVVRDLRYQTLKLPYLEALTKKETIMDEFQEDMVRFSLVMANENIELPVDILKRMINLFPGEDRYVRALIKAALKENQLTAIHHLNHIFNRPYRVEVWRVIAEDIIDVSIKAKDASVMNVIAIMFSKKFAVAWNDIAEKVIDTSVMLNNPEPLRQLVKQAFSQPHSAAWEKTLFKMIDVAVKMKDSPILQHIALDVLGESHFSSNTILIEKVFQAAMSIGDRSTIAVLAENIYPEKVSKEFLLKVMTALIESRNSEALLTLTKRVLVHSPVSGWKEVSEKLILASVQLRDIRPIIELRGVSGSPAYLKDVVSLFEKNRDWVGISKMVEGNAKMASGAVSVKGLSCNDAIAKFIKH